jgi:hypothetical protein
VELLYPNMRSELLAELESFAIPGVEDAGGYDNDGWWVGAGDMVCDLPDDLLAGAPTPADADKLIGVMLYDQDDADAVSRLLVAIDDLLKQLDLPASDAEFVAAAGWPPVVEAAANAHVVLSRRGS